MNEDTSTQTPDEQLRYLMTGKRCLNGETNLFVIERRDVTSMESYYWSCCPEHGTGWNPGTPKQAFSPSELTKTLRQLIDEGWWSDCKIKMLHFK